MTGDADRLRRIDAIFNSALDLPPEARAAWVHAECGEDADMCEHVLSLLHAVTAAEFALGENVGGYAADLLNDLHAAAQRPGAALEPGTRLGAWRVLHEIGRGGMGAVHLAERADGQFAMRAAIKLLGGEAGPAAIRRLESERKILATLDHPGIARLHDGGTTEAGVPYIVMQLVEGSPIDSWCDERGVDVRGRVALVRDVARAVHHAHRALIVHRDVKPSNILVTNEGAAVLVDFGIARLLDGAAAGTPPLTRTGMQLLTPEYAAPEQLAGGSITTATDVHALGAVLYELLTGTRPFAASGGSLGSVVRAVLETVPAAPSMVVGREASSVRATTPDRLRAVLQGDLDTIVLRALAKEPERRYASALQFADDLDRWLNGMPVLARGDSLRYRAGKFVARHRAGTAAALLAALLLAAAGAGLVRSAERTSQALELAETERDRAALERDRAERTARFLQGLFSASNPYAPRGQRLDTLRVPALLGLGAAQARAEAGESPVASAELLTTIGTAYRGLGAPDDAASVLDEAIALLRTSNESLLLATALNELGVIRLMQERPAEAEPLIREAAALRAAGMAHDAPPLLTTRINLASALQNQGRFDDARPIYDEVIATLRARQEPDSVRLAETLNARAALAHRTGDAESAVRLMQEALAINRALLGDEHPRVAREIHNVAFVMDRAGRLDEAEPLYAQSVMMHSRLFEPSHPAVWHATSAYADALARLGRTTEATPLFEQVLSQQRAARSPPPPDVANTLRLYSALLERTGDLAGAEAAARASVDVLSGAVDPRHPGVAAGRARLARILCARGRVDEALTHFDAVGRLMSGSPSGPEALAVAADHGACLVRARRYADAEGVLLAAWLRAGQGDPLAEGPAIPAGAAHARLAEVLAEVHALTGRTQSSQQLRARLVADAPL